MDTASDPLRMRRLLDAGRALVGELDPHAVLDRILAAAREVTGARYAALAILGEHDEVDDLLTIGIDEHTRDGIGDLPSGRGLLGVLWQESQPLRLADVSEHARSIGVPPGHPPMRSFLGVPILHRETAWGGLYLTEKQGGPFTAADEEAAVILADWAATAIEEARLARRSGGRRVADAPAIAAGDTGLERVLELIVRRGRTLIDTSSLGPSDALTRDDEQRLRAFAASAATAVALAQSVESDRLRSLLAAADAERSRWARELHDETLQGLGALHLLLAAARRRGDARQTELAVDEAIEHIQQEIENLHAIITDLRPAALDQLGLRPALDALIESRGAHGAPSITAQLTLPGPGDGDDRLAPEVESTIYRLTQEALTNVVKHAHARAARVTVVAAEGTVVMEVRDDGAGFATDAAASGYGLANMRERVTLAGGTLAIESGPAGTLVRAELPAPARGAGR
ncbi:GAF domain-containing sensor histidine kinase [Conexibacter woesei]|uniref:GAF domain-containing sensor histidine kinase n=1 Tax=Conexibacter woesei TaxID=191495 RepID=UPI00040D2705|nr:GAF domain-containing sensor histidine kinase [Conexibacter woesei]